MASTDKKNVISSLIESGKAKGKLSTKDITDALEELDYDVEQVDKLYEHAGRPEHRDRRRQALPWMTIWISWIWKARTAKMPWTSPLWMASTSTTR